MKRTKSKDIGEEVILDDDGNIVARYFNNKYVWNMADEVETLKARLDEFEKELRNERETTQFKLGNMEREIDERVKMPISEFIVRRMWRWILRWTPDNS